MLWMLMTGTLPIPICSMCGLFTYICVVLVVNVGKYTIHIHTLSIWVCTIHAMNTLCFNPWISLISSNRFWFLAFSASNPSNVHRSPCSYRDLKLLQLKTFAIEGRQDFEKKHVFLNILRQLKASPKKTPTWCTIWNSTHPSNPPIVLQLKIKQET